VDAETNRIGESEQSALRAIAIHDSLGEPHHLQYLVLLNALAGSYEGQKRFREGLLVYRRAAALLDSMGRQNTLASVYLQHNIGTSLSNLGESAEAESLLHEVVVRAAKSDPSGQVPAIPLGSYASSAIANEHLDSALKYYRFYYDRAAAEQNPEFQARALAGLVRVYLRKGDLETARHTLEQYIAASAKLPKRFSADEEALAGWMARAEGDTARAYEHFKNALRLGRYFDGNRAPSLRATLTAAAEAAIVIGKTDDALGYLDAVQKIFDVDSLSSKRSAYLGEAGLLRARAYLARGDSAAARTTLDKAQVALRVGLGEKHSRTREAEALIARLRR
jgi:hypothetical protein